MSCLSIPSFGVAPELQLLLNDDDTHPNSGNVVSYRGMLVATVTLSLPPPTRIDPKNLLTLVELDHQILTIRSEVFSEANKKLHETNESLRDALDSRASVIKQFNLVSSLISCHRSSRTRCLTSQRTPSPNPALVRNASEGMVMYQSQCEPLRLPTPATLSELPTEEDGEHIPLETAGSVLSFEICSRFGSRNVV